MYIIVMIIKKRNKKTENFRLKCSHYRLDEKNNILFIEKYLNNTIEYNIPRELEKNKMMKKIHELQGHSGFNRMA